MHEDLKTCTSSLRENEPRYQYKYPEFDEVDALKKEKAIEKTMEFATVSRDKEDEKSEISVKKISEKDIEKKKENKVLIVLGAVFAGMAVVAATVVALLILLPGAGELKVPDVSGMSVNMAVSELNKLGLKVAAENKYSQSDTIEEGDVVKTDPSYGRTVKKGSEITIYVSQGTKSFDLEDYVINSMLIDSLRTALSPDEFELIRIAYLTEDCTLYRYCIEHNWNYPKKRRELIALLPKIRKFIEN